MNRPLQSAFETVKYWTGQKILHSPLHPYYLKLTGYQPPPQTYEAWLEAAAAAERRQGPGPAGYSLLDPSVRLHPDATGWLSAAVAATDADVVYADEDVLDPVTGQRSQPVFKPAWSPELYARCDYWNGAAWIRDGVNLATDWRRLRVVHVPQVLFHRSQPSATPRRVDASLQAPSETPLVSILICSRNPALAADCLEALRSNTDYAGGYEVILVDHRAGMQELADRYGARRLDYRDDFNFARMCNAAAQLAKGPLLLLLNDDTVPLDRTWLARMAAQAVRADVGVVGALLTFPDGRIQHAGVMIGTSNGAGHPGRLSEGSSLWPWLKCTREQLAVTGACLMIRREVFHQMGGLDEQFPVNYNDVDLCLQCVRAGFTVLLEAEARVEHRESTTRKIGIRYGERRRFLDRWSRFLERCDPYFNPNLSDNELLLPEPRAFALNRIEPWR